MPESTARLGLARLSPLGEREPKAPASGVAPARFTADGVELVELPFVAQIRLQTTPADRARVAAIAPERLPAAPNRALGEGDGPWILWRGPGDWLAYSLTRSADELAARLARDFADLPLVATDISASLAVCDLGGARAIDVLMRDLTLDLEGDALPPGGCAQTHFAHVGLLLHRPTAEPRYRLWVDRSVARHVWDWLVDSADLTTPPAPR